MRERGLKQVVCLLNAQADLVAPHAGAWIETPQRTAPSPTSGMSLPMRERGLKQLVWCNVSDQNKSLPMRERGLKQ